MAAPASPPSARPAMAPSGPADHAADDGADSLQNERGHEDLSQSSVRETERVGEMTAPPGAERHLGDPRAVMGMHHRVGRGRDGAVLGGAMIAPAEQQHVAGRRFPPVDLDEMPRAPPSRAYRRPLPPNRANRAAAIRAPRP